MAAVQGLLRGGVMRTGAVAVSVLVVALVGTALVRGGPTGSQGRVDPSQADEEVGLPAVWVLLASPEGVELIAPAENRSWLLWDVPVATALADGMGGVVVETRTTEDPPGLFWLSPGAPAPVEVLQMSDEQRSLRLLAAGTWRGRSVALLQEQSFADGPADARLVVVDLEQGGLKELYRVPGHVWIEARLDAEGISAWWAGGTTRSVLVEPDGTAVAPHPTLPGLLTSDPTADVSGEAWARIEHSTQQIGERAVGTGELVWHHESGNQTSYRLGPGLFESVDLEGGLALVQDVQELRLLAGDGRTVWRRKARMHQMGGPVVHAALTAVAVDTSIATPSRRAALTASRLRPGHPPVELIETVADGVHIRTSGRDARRWTVPGVVHALSDAQDGLVAVVSELAPDVSSRSLVHVAADGTTRALHDAARNVLELHQIIDPQGSPAALVSWVTGTGGPHDHRQVLARIALEPGGGTQVLLDEAAWESGIATATAFDGRVVSLWDAYGWTTWDVLDLQGQPAPHDDLALPPGAGSGRITQAVAGDAVTGMLALLDQRISGQLHLVVVDPSVGGEVLRVAVPGNELATLDVHDGYAVISPRRSQAPDAIFPSTVVRLQPHDGSVDTWDLGTTGRLSLKR